MNATTSVANSDAIPTPSLTYYPTRLQPNRSSNLSMPRNTSRHKPAQQLLPIPHNRANLKPGVRLIQPLPGCSSSHLFLAIPGCPRDAHFSPNPYPHSGPCRSYPTIVITPDLAIFSLRFLTGEHGLKWWGSPTHSFSAALSAGGCGTLWLL